MTHPIGLIVLLSILTIICVALLVLYVRGENSTANREYHDWKDTQ